MASWIHGLSLASTLVGLCALLSSAAPEGDAEPTDPIPALNRCCNPATPQPPASGAGCVTDCVEGAVICAIVFESGTWSTATCTSQEESTCTKGKRKVPTPKYTCGMAACTTDDGKPGKQCVWTLAGYDTGNLQEKDVCSGSPCTG
jgi:hypothetical protein